MVATQVAQGRGATGTDAAQVLLSSMARSAQPEDTCCFWIGAAVGDADAEANIVGGTVALANIRELKPILCGDGGDGTR